jgi:hypothetical protein
MRKGDITVVIDEAIYLVEQMRLRAELDELYHAGRACGISVLANAQRPTWVSRGMATQPDWLVTFRAGDLSDRKRLAEIMGDPSARYWLDKVPKHEFVISRPNHSSSIYRSHLTEVQAKSI